jgi:hypothetical protein
MADYKRTELDARAHLGEERFAAVWAQASDMSLGDAVAYALADEEAPKTPEAVAATTQLKEIRGIDCCEGLPERGVW